MLRTNRHSYKPSTYYPTKIRSYQEQLWSGQRTNKQNLFLLTDIRTNRRLQCTNFLSRLSQPANDASEVAKVSSSTASSLNCITILNDSALLGHTAVWVTVQTPTNCHLLHPTWMNLVRLYVHPFFTLQYIPALCRRGIHQLIH